MLTQLLDLPPELLQQILSTLPLTPLLRFAQTCLCARNLAYSCLKGLSLEIHPPHRSPWQDQLFSTGHKPQHGLHAVIRIPQAWDFDATTLLTFHNKITSSILHRHAHSLQKLELTLWTLSMPIARSLAALPALRDLRIRIQSAQGMGRGRGHAHQRQREEYHAWEHLSSSSTAWAQGLTGLRIEGAQINTAQALSLVGAAAPRLTHLALRRCDMVTSCVWDANVLRGLRSLCLAGCANVHVAAPALEAIGCMRRLQVLDLDGCSGMDGEVLDAWNRDVWRVPVFVAPRPRALLKEDMLIEVDPDYLLGED